MMLKRVLPFPPTINGYWRSYKGRQILSAKARDFKVNVNAVFYQEPCSMIPPKVKITMFVCLYPPDKRKRDSSNYLKALEDSMIGLAYKDDSQIKEHHIFMLEPTPKYPKGAVEVSLLWEGE